GQARHQPSRSSSVADGPQAQPVRRCDATSRSTVARAEDSQQVPRADLAEAHVDERPDKSAHHLPTEGGGADVVTKDAVSGVAPLRREHAPDRVRTGRTLPAEGREVVLTEERVGAEPQ